MYKTRIFTHTLKYIYNGRFTCIYIVVVYIHRHTYILHKLYLDVYRCMLIYIYIYIGSRVCLSPLNNLPC